MKNFNLVRYTLAILIGYAFLFGFDFVWHGKLLMPMYEETSELWRAQDTMKDFMSWSMLTSVLLVVVTATLYLFKHEGKGIAEGLRFGGLIGLIIGLLTMKSYAYMPISITLALGWGAHGLILGFGLGVIFSLIYKEKTLETKSKEDAKS
jgi:sterol desaturase/sphingolipid hydroxylase (fatty acid hydroxylase superfamily)